MHACLCCQLSIDRGEDGLFKELARAENFSAAGLHIHSIEKAEFAKIVIDLKADSIHMHPSMYVHDECMPVCR